MKPIAAPLATDHLTTATIPMPRLTDDAVVQIHDFSLPLPRTGHVVCNTHS